MYFTEKDAIFYYNRIVDGEEFYLLIPKENNKMLHIEYDCLDNPQFFIREIPLENENDLMELSIDIKSHLKKIIKHRKEHIFDDFLIINEDFFLKHFKKDTDVINLIEEYKKFSN